MCVVDCGCCGFGQVEEVYFVLFDQLCYCVYGVFDWYGVVYVVLVVQIDVVYVQLCQVGFVGGDYVFGVVIYVVCLGVGGFQFDVEFGGQKYLVVMIGNGFVDQYFVGVWVVYVGGVEQGYVVFQCVVDYCGCVGIVVMVVVEGVYVYVVQVECGNSGVVVVKGMGLYGNVLEVGKGGVCMCWIYSIFCCIMWINWCLLY